MGGEWEVEVVGGCIHTDIGTDVAMQVEPMKPMLKAPGTTI